MNVNILNSNFLGTPEYASNVQSSAWYDMRGHASNAYSGLARIANKASNAWCSVRGSIANTFRRATGGVSGVWYAIQHPNYKSINKTLRGFEWWLNIFGDIPGPSLVSSQVRECLGWGEIIGGLSIAVFHRALGFLTSDQELKKRYDQNVQKDINYCGHGVLNLFRAQLERSMVLNLFVLRIAYDLLGFRVEYSDAPNCAQRRFCSITQCV